MQIAVGVVQLQHVEAGALGHLGRAHELRRARPSMSARVISRGTWLCGRPRHRRRRHHLPVAAARAARPSLPAELGRALGARMAELDGDLRVGLGVDEIDDALPGRLVLGRVEAGAAGRDAPLRRDAGHLGEDEAGAALGALGVVHEVPVRRRAVDGAVLRHRRDHDAVLQAHVAQAERREHRRARGVGLARPSPAPRTTSPRPRATPCRAGAGSRG